MKRFLSLLIAAMLVFPCLAFAETDLSHLSLEELESLRLDVCAEILSRSQWGSVTVPEGFYVIGEDIPSGHWTIKPEPGQYFLIEYFLRTDDTGKRPADILVHDYYTDSVCDPASEMSYVSGVSQIDLDLKEGYHLVISYGSAIFEPFTGRNSPFFN